jgi:hypothetical protein
MSLWAEAPVEEDDTIELYSAYLIITHTVP